MKEKSSYNNIYYNNLIDIDTKEKIEINNLILSSFKTSRLKFYEKIVYYKINDKIIGVAGLYFIDKYLSINQLCTHKDYRKMGIASQLLSFICEIYKSTAIILYIDKNKENTNYLYNFYINRGFKEIDYLQTFNLTYENDIEYLMIKDQ